MGEKLPVSKDYLASVPAEVRGDQSPEAFARKEAAEILKETFDIAKNLYQGMSPEQKSKILEELRNRHAELGHDLSTLPGAQREAVMNDFISTMDNAMNAAKMAREAEARQAKITEAAKTEIGEINIVSLLQGQAKEQNVGLQQVFENYLSKRLDPNDRRYGQLMEVVGRYSGKSEDAKTLSDLIIAVVEKARREKAA